MTQETESVETRPEPPPLKVVEREPDPQKPWADDVLERREVADRLTSIVREQDQPFVISVDGGWGTGKTFLLKRWKQDLENQGWQAIYFNAWEDDFSDDPLLAIIGQLSDYFDDGALKKAAFAVADAALGILTKHLTGAAVHLEDLTTEGLLDDYRTQQETKKKLKEELISLAASVHEETEQPLVFIIDELDRCRPTFAIELLERVKHIFDVPNMVFVFGINRSELTESLRSVYGEIDAGTYLRRFFDMPLVLPEADASTFCVALFERFGLASFFEQMTSHAKSRVHIEEFRVVSRHAPLVFGALGLSLRDIDYCVRAIALVGKSMEPRNYMHPFLLIVLVALRIDNPSMFRRLVHKEGRAREVVEYLDEKFHRSGLRNRETEGTFDFVEVCLYSSDREAWTYFAESMWPQGDVPVPSGAFSKRTEAEDGRLERLAREASGFNELGEGGLTHVAKLIDLLQTPR